ncbi:MAG: Ig-like domain-containing protein, partial [Candidatus Thermoplasmatota archaeon]
YTNVIITLSAADYASITPLSGVKEIRYKVITNDIEPADYEVYNGSCIVLTDGRHKLKYWAVDNASNEEDPHIGPAIYVDTTPPNAYSLSLAGGVDYTNTIIVSCAIGVFENESAIMEWNISFNNWQTYRVLATGSLVIDLTLEPAGDGLKQVWVKVRDKGGWESVAVTDTITVDTVPPSLSNEAPTGYVTTTTAPTISITVTWDGAPVTQATCWMYIDGTSVAPTLVGNTLSYTPTGLSQGLHEVEVVVEDVAGNQQSKKWTFTIDTIPPVIGSPTPTPDSTVTTTTVTVSAVFTEETSGIDVTTIVMTINGAVVAHSYAPATGTVSYVLAIPVGTYATYTVIVNVKDKAGLAATPLNWSFIADTRLPDTTAPTTTPSVEPSVPATGWYITNVYVNLTATDPTVANAITSGVKEIRYQIVKDGTPGAVVIVSGNVAHIVLSEGGKYIVKYWAVDNANNEELESSTPEIKIDKTAPTGTILINADATYTTTTAVTLTVSATDAGSGVSQMCFSNDNIIYTAWESYGTSKLWTLTTGDETKTVYVKFKDVAGLESTAFSDTIILDTTAPTGTISINADATYTTSTAVTLTLTASDANGVASICFSNDGTTYTGWETISTMKSWVLTAGDETKTVYVKFKDVAGIESGAFRDTIILDTTKPIGNVSINAGAIYTKTTAVTLTLSASDANGVATMCFSNDGVMYSSPETYNTTKLWTLSAGDGTKFVYVKFIDSAGNEIVVTDDIILDATRPAVSIVGGDRTVRYAEKKITFTAVVSDDVITYEWRIVDEADRELKTSIDPSVTYEFPDRGGTYTVTLTVTDKAGNTNTATVTIIVRPKPTPPFIPGFEALALIAALAVVAIVAVKSRKKKQ